MTPEDPAPHFKPFASVADARQSLIWNRHYTITTGRPWGQWDRNSYQYTSAKLHEWKRHELLRLNEWDSQLDTFLKTRGATLSDWEMKGVKTLQMYKLLSWTSLSVDPREDQTGWDELRPVFEEMINLAAAIVEIDDLASNRTAFFSTDIGITGALSEVVSRCRHPVLRRKAIAVLRHGLRQEGIWNSVLTANAAERMMLVEEQGCGEVKEEADVPGWARLSHVNLAFDPVAKRAVLSYSRLGSKFDLIKKEFKDILEW